MNTIIASSTDDATLKQLIAVMLDVADPQHVEVAVSNSGTVLWVNINGICVLRCSRVKQLKINIDHGVDFL